MFDLGFSEIVVIAIVLLIVVGPERLPGVARCAGRLLGRFQRYVAEVKADIRREIQIDDLKKLREQAQALDKTFRAEAGALQADVREALIFPDEAAPQAEPVDAPAPEDAGQAVPEPAPEPAPQLELDLGTEPALPATPADAT